MVQLVVVDILVFWGIEFLASYIPMHHNVLGNARTYHLELLTKIDVGYKISY